MAERSSPPHQAPHGASQTAAHPGPNRPELADPATTDSVRAVGLAAGLAAVGVTSASVLQPARDLLHRRKSAGLAASMAFTYRNPDRSTDPKAHLPSARSLIAGAWSYHPADVGHRRPGQLVDSTVPGEAPQESSAAAGTPGRVARYVWEDHYAELRAALWSIAHALRAQGHRATVLADSNHLVDRNVAWRAGLGWYGKNANLLVPGVGSWVVLGAVVTSAELEPTGPPIQDGCGPCRRCLDDCPTGAILAPGVVDAGRCLAWLVQAGGSFPPAYREALGDRIYGCDDCQDVCPPNRDRSGRPPGEPASESTGVADQGRRSEPGSQHTSTDVEWLLTATDDEILDRHGQWYIADRKVDNLRRSALVVLGNVGDPARAEVVELIETYLAHDEPLLRGHAVWAARRLGLGDLADRLVDDPDPEVRIEAARTVRPRPIGGPHRRETES